MRENKGKRVLAFLLSVVVLLGTLFSDVATAKSYAASNADDSYYYSSNITTFVTAEDLEVEYDGQSHVPHFDTVSQTDYDYCKLSTWAVYNKADYDMWGSYATAIDSGRFNSQSYGLAAINGQTNVGEYTFVVKVEYGNKGFFGFSDTAKAVANLTIKEAEDPNATVPVAVYATAGYVGKYNTNEASVEAWNDNIKELTGVEFVQYDGYAPLGVIYIPRSVIKSIGDSSKMLNSDNIDTVLSYLSTLDTSFLKDDGVKNANNVIINDANFINYIERDFNNSSSSHQTALFTWNQDEVGYISGSYKYHLDIRFATEEVNYVGVVDGKTSNKDLVRIGEYTHLKGAAIDAPSYDTNTNCDINGKTYFVEGYYTDKACSNVWTSSSKNTTIYVKLSSTHTITIDPNGGSYQGDTTINGVHAGQVVDIATPTRDGYTFTGWTGGTVTNGVYTVENKDVTLKAEWSANDYTLTVDPNGGVYNKQTSYSQLHIGNTKDLGTTSKVGYNFIGWTVNDNNHGATVNGNIVTMGSADAVATANFTANTDTKYTVVYKYEDLEDSSETKYGTTDTAIDIDELIAAGAKVGYTVDSANTTQSATIAPDGSTVVTIAYEKVVYTLNVVAGKGIETASGDKTTYKFGEIATLTAVAATGYDFANWTGVTTATTPVTIIEFDEAFATANAGTEFTVTANANIQKHSVIVEYYNEDGTTAGTDTKTEEYGSEVTFTPNPGEGYTAYEGAKDPETGKVVPNTNKPVDEIKKTIGTDDETVVVVFVADAHKVTVNYVYEDGTTASNSYETTVKYGDTFSVNSPDQEGFSAYVAYSVNGGYAAKEENGAKVLASVVSGTMGIEDVTVNVVYIPNAYRLTISYIYEDKTPVLVNGTSVDVDDTVVFGKDYSYDSQSITGYTPNLSVVKGTMPAENVDVVVTYSLNRHNLVIEYYVEGENQPFKTETKENQGYGKEVNYNIPEKTGHTPFVGDEEVSTGNHTFTMGDEDANVRVIYKPNHYDVIVFDNLTQEEITRWEDAVVYGQKFDSDNYANAFQVPEHKGYSYCGVLSSVTSQDTVKDDVILYALFEKESFDVKFIDYNGTELKSDKVLYEDTAAAPETPERTNWQFAGWVIEGTKDVVTDFTITENTTFVATYTQTGSNLKVNFVYESDNSKAFESIDQAYEIGTPVKYFAGKELEGFDAYVLDGNKKVAVDASSAYTVTAEDKEITVYYSKNSYKLTVEYVDITGSPVKLCEDVIVDVPYGATLTDYYETKTFEGYYLHNTTGNNKMEAKDKTITLKYKKSKYDVLVEFVYKNEDKPSYTKKAGKVSIGENYTVRVTGIPAGYSADQTVFTGKVEKTGDLKLTVNLYKDYVITYVDKDGNSLNRVQKVSASFDDEKNATFTAKINKLTYPSYSVIGVDTYEFEFKGWALGEDYYKYGDAITITGDVTLKASYEDIPVAFYLLNPAMTIPADEIKGQSSDNYSDSVAADGNFDLEKWYAADVKQVLGAGVAESGFLKENTPVFADFGVDGYRIASNENPEIEWYVVKIQADGIHVDGFVNNQVETAEVRYVDNNGRVSISEEDNEKIEVAFDAKTAAVEVKEFEGYTLNKNFDAANAKIEIVDGQKVIYVPYDINTYILTVHYFTNDKTDVAMPVDEQYPVVYNGHYEYDENSKIPAGFHACFPESGIIKGHMPARDKTRTLELAKNEYVVKVTYEIVGGKTEAPASVSANALFEEGYSIKSPEVAGYTPDIEVVSGNIGAGDEDIVVKYYPNTYDVVVYYYDAEDESEPFYTEKVSVSFNEAYSVEVTPLEGYTPDRDIVEGTLTTVGGTTEVVTFSRNSYKLSIKFNGLDDLVVLPWDNVPEDFETSVLYNDPYFDILDAHYPFLEGYSTTNDIDWNVDDKMPAKDLEFNVTYVKDDYTVTYLYEDKDFSKPYAIDTYKARESFELREDGPAKDMDVEFIFTFAGWIPYYEKEDRPVVRVNEAVVRVVREAARGVDAIIPEEVPFLEPGIRFEGDYAKYVDIILGNLVFYPEYTAETRVFTVSFENYDGTVIDSQRVLFDNPATAPSNPTRVSEYNWEENTVTHYQFAGWDKAFDRVTSDLIITATYTSYTGDMFAPEDNPPTENPPAENPPAQNPPAQNPPAQNPPAENPPAENPPAENPPAQVVEIEEEKVPEQATPEIIPEPVPEPVVVEIPEEKTPLAASSHCIIHWIILMITLLDAVYAVLRAMTNAKEIKEEEKEVSNN